MSIDESREAFERAFPVPANAKWSEAHENYGWIKRQGNLEPVYRYRSMWQAWQRATARLEADAERYAWLRENADAGWDVFYEQIEIRFPSSVDGFDDIDGAVDAARREREL